MQASLAQEILDPDFAADLDEHLRAAHPPSLLADREGRIQAYAFFAKRLEDHEDGHDLAHGRGRHRQVRAAVQEHRAGVVVHQNDLAGACLDAGGGPCGGGQEQRRHENKRGGNRRRVAPGA
jgi:hypothetical protein